MWKVLLVDFPLRMIVSAHWPAVDLDLKNMIYNTVSHYPVIKSFCGYTCGRVTLIYVMKSIMRKLNWHQSRGHLTCFSTEMDPHTVRSHIRCLCLCFCFYFPGEIQRVGLTYFVLLTHPQLIAANLLSTLCRKKDWLRYPVFARSLSILTWVITWESTTERRVFILSP